MSIDTPPAWPAQAATRDIGPDFAARISIRGARAAFVGPALNLAPHRNAVAVLAMALAAPFSLTRFENGGAEFTDESLHAALIPPGQRHCLRAGGGMGFVYLDALSDDHESATVADLHTHRAAFIEALRGGWSVDDLCSCIGLPRKPPPDPRIAALLREIDANPNVFPRLDVAADFVGVSPSRCRELMRLAPGVPFRRYRLWRRFALVIREVSRGHTLTGAALDAGFASSAHLSAAFKAMFGLAPSSITKLGAAIDVD